MALNYITLILDLADGTGTPLATGQALLAPSSLLTDDTDDMIVTQAQVTAKFAGPNPPVRIIATYNADLAPSGWAWTVHPRSLQKSIMVNSYAYHENTKLHNKGGHEKRCFPIPQQRPERNFGCKALSFQGI